jgi:type III restriction enzyme
MSYPFFDRPILNSPYEYPLRHWELDEAGQPTQKIIDARRSAKFITPIPKPKKRKTTQAGFVFDEGKGLSTKEQQYDPTSIINEVRGYVDAWRQLSPSQWQVTPETARLLQHWRHHEFSGVRPFFCQVEAAGNRDLAYRGRASVSAGQARLGSSGGSKQGRQPGTDAARPETRDGCR